MLQARLFWEPSVPWLVTVPSITTTNTLVWAPDGLKFKKVLLMTNPSILKALMLRSILGFVKTMLRIGNTNWLKWEDISRIRDSSLEEKEMARKVIWFSLPSSPLLKELTTDWNKRIYSPLNTLSLST